MKKTNRVLDVSRRSALAENFQREMLRKVVGQDEAVEPIVNAYEAFLAGFYPPNRPICNMMLLGPTGTGKTRTIEAMAECLFGDVRALLKINCAEYQHDHEIAKLVGSPPGYLGHRETHPMLTDEALRQWWTDNQRLSLVLFDEIEKANDSLWKLLLGILDKAELTLGDNRRVDFSQAMIFMTSNVGASEMNRMTETAGFGKGMVTPLLDERQDKRMAERALEAMRRKFSPEFVNRLDRVAVFKTLRREHIEQILELELGMVQQRILQMTGNAQFVFTCDLEVKLLLLEEGYDEDYGARHLKRVIERRLVFPLSTLVSTKQVKLGDFVRVSLMDGEFQFTKEAEGALVPVLLDKYGYQAAAAGK